MPSATSGTRTISASNHQGLSHRASAITRRARTMTAHRALVRMFSIMTDLLGRTACATTVAVAGSVEDVAVLVALVGSGCGGEGCDVVAGEEALEVVAPLDV